MRSKLISLIIICLLLIPAYADSYALISISTLKYEPSPAQPGKYLRLYLNVENVGTANADNLIIVLEPNYPFYLDKSENATRDIGMLEPSKNAIIDYKIRVASDAVEGDNELKLKYSTDGNMWIEKKITITIQTLDANLAIKNFESKPIEPGKTNTLKITIKNEADSYLRDINLKLDLSNLPFSPINHTEEKRIYHLESGEEKILKFNLLASPDADSNPYKIPLEISYYDSIGQKYEKTNYVTLIINSKPEIEVALDKSTILSPNKVGEITLDVINKGLTKIKFLTVYLEKSNEYEILSPSMVYIGNLEPDDYDTIDYKIYVKSNSGKFPLKLTLNYRDNNNKIYSEEKTVNLIVYSENDLRRYNFVSEDYTMYIICFIVIIFLLYIYRKKKK
ncbi:MAG: hypothetical protein B6U88_00315 [Candidatus Aenigmarchaeota archaeon ex4484_56]|nr:MAG: hypothetical protein B6U88_00315 [Candidatus Aenigmarchaeota archaeon ex4484_56]